MVKRMCAAVAVLLLMPLAAMAAEHCPRDPDPGTSHPARTEHVETVPAAKTAESCPQHWQLPCALSFRMMPSCAINGCCIKTDVPLAAGMGSRPLANVSFALGLSVIPPFSAGRQVGTAPYRWLGMQDRLEPALRPPLGQTACS